MIRLYVTDRLGPDYSLILSENAHHYLRHVMRRQVGDEILLFNGLDGEWSAVLETPDKNRTAVRICHQTRKQTIQPTLILCPALIKKDPMDFVLQKATELGVSAIYPLITERTIVTRLNPDRAHDIVVEAAEQSERLSVPTIAKPQSPAAVLAALPPDIQPICLAERTTAPFHPLPDRRYALFIGPEGGWTPAEFDLFRRSKTELWHLGDTILRADTASVAALACCRFCS